MMDDEEVYELTPKGIFALALLKTKLIEDVMDWRIDTAWTIFELVMKQNGYIQEPEDSE